MKSMSQTWTIAEWGYDVKDKGIAEYTETAIWS